MLTCGNGHGGLAYQTWVSVPLPGISLVGPGAR